MGVGVGMGEMVGEEWEDTLEGVGREDVGGRHPGRAVATVVEEMEGKVGLRVEMVGRNRYGCRPDEAEEYVFQYAMNN